LEFPFSCSFTAVKRIQLANAAMSKCFSASKFFGGGGMAASLAAQLLAIVLQRSPHDRHIVVAHWLSKLIAGLLDRDPAGTRIT